MWDGRETVADGINEAGKVCGNYSELVSQNPITYRNRGLIYDGTYGTFNRVSYDDAYTTYARDINNNGEVLGSWGSTGTFVLDSHGTYYLISLPDASFNSLSGFNDNGLSVGYNYYSREALIFNITNSNYSYFAFPLNNSNFILTSTSAADINNNNIIVGTYSVRDDDFNFHYYGFIKQGDSFTTIEYPGATETYVNGINDFDQIVGEYVDSSSVTHGFIGNLIPIPPTLLLCGTGLLGLGALAWRRRTNQKEKFME
jgi:hypothetical protein